MHEVRNIVNTFKMLFQSAFVLFAVLLPDYSSADEYCYQSLETLDPNNDPHANCLEVSTDGHITRVFRGAQKQPGHVYPGLWDGHGHLLQYGELLKSVDLFGSGSLDETLDRITAYATAHPDAGTATQWLRGVGWDQAVFGRMPTAVSRSDGSQLRLLTLRRQISGRTIDWGISSLCWIALTCIASGCHNRF